MYFIFSQDGHYRPDWGETVVRVDNLLLLSLISRSLSVFIIAQHWLSQLSHGVKYDSSLGTETSVKHNYFNFNIIGNYQSESIKIWLLDVSWDILNSYIIYISKYISEYSFPSREIILVKIAIATAGSSISLQTKQSKYQIY